MRISSIPDQVWVHKHFLTIKIKKEKILHWDFIYRIYGRCHRKFCRPEILSRRQFFLGNSITATIFPRRFCRSILTQRPHFLGNSVALLHRDTSPRSTAEFDIGGGTRGDWGAVPPLMSREEAASYIGNAVAALK